eukprot:m.477133 g.477133  ORF g.477133 m.477133 type:complete len:253 (-) comp20755_c0_seq1:51-809(-)
MAAAAGRGASAALTRCLWGTPALASRQICTLRCLHATQKQPLEPARTHVRALAVSCSAAASSSGGSGGSLFGRLFGRDEQQKTPSSEDTGSGSVYSELADARSYDDETDEHDQRVMLPESAYASPKTFATEFATVKFEDELRNHPGNVLDFPLDNTQKAELLVALEEAFATAEDGLSEAGAGEDVRGEAVPNAALMWIGTVGDAAQYFEGLGDMAAEAEQTKATTTKFPSKGIAALPNLDPATLPPNVSFHS